MNVGDDLDRVKSERKQFKEAMLKGKSDAALINSENKTMT